VKNGTEERTRNRVLRLLLELGSATAADLGVRLDLSPAAVRRHLDALLADGSIRPSGPPGEGPRGRGRPARAFTLTEAGRETFPQAYDGLASAALHALATHGGEAAVRAFLDARTAEIETRYRDRVVAAPDPAAALADALSEDGYAASAGAGTVCQHHCPVQHVAEQFPQLCEAEAEAFARIVGSPVRRLTTIAHGEPCCTTVISPGRTSS
jgi:predicted ArsR family transcriptional regulator